MNLSTRVIKKEDLDVISKWWDYWYGPDKVDVSILPANGLGGIVVEKDDNPVCAGFIYLTNGGIALIEWVVSDPNYRDEDRGDAVVLLIESCIAVARDQGYKYIYSSTNNSSIIEKCKTIGCEVSDKTFRSLIKRF
jgi:GNAT superfamily N-acetyltransferase